MFISPRRLKEGDRVAIVAPASPFQTEELSVGLDVIRECGLEPVLGPNVKRLRSNNIHAASAKQRAEEMMWAFTETSLSAVIPVVGGCGSGEILPLLDFEKIRASGKALMGMSDITALNNGFLAKAGLISINGQSPSIRVDEGQSILDADEQSLLHMLQLVMSNDVWGDDPFIDNPYIPRTLSSGTAFGHVVGGNLDTFCTLLGSPFMPELTGAILFIEDTGKSGETLARMFIHCKLAGVFDKIAGIVVGEFVKVPKKEVGKVPSIEDVLHNYLSNGPPCVYGYNFSHGASTAPIPIGAKCFIDADTGDVKFDFKMRG